MIIQDEEENAFLAGNGPGGRGVCAGVDLLHHEQGDSRLPVGGRLRLTVALSTDRRSIEVTGNGELRD